MTLSKENFDSLNENFLYKKEPVIDNSFSVGTTPGTYHCKNWSFIIKKYDDGRAFIADTYFKDHWQPITDENISNYEKVFDFRDVMKISDESANDYEDEDKYFVATGSGGYSCGGCNWVKKTAVKSARLLKIRHENAIATLEWKLKYEREQLKKIEDQLKTQSEVSHG